MPDFVNTSTLDVVLSVNDATAPWTVLTRTEANAALAIPQKYRKWTGSAVAEMTSGEKATVDAAEAAAKAAALVTNFDTSAPPGIFRAVIKPSTTTRTATTTLANDPHLTFPVLASAKYRFWFSVFFDTTAAGDFKIGLSGPASPTALRFFRYAVAPAGTALTAVGVSTAYNTGVGIAGTGTTGGYAVGYGILSNGINAGDVAVSWAQNTSDAGNTSVLEGSMLYYARIG